MRANRFFLLSLFAFMSSCQPHPVRSQSNAELGHDFKINAWSVTCKGTSEYIYACDMSKSVEGLGFFRISIDNEAATLTEVFCDMTGVRKERVFHRRELDSRGLSLSLHNRIWETAELCDRAKAPEMDDTLQVVYLLTLATKH